MSQKIYILEVDGAGITESPEFNIDQIVVSQETLLKNGDSYRRATINPTGAAVFATLSRFKGLDIWVSNVVDLAGNTIIPDGYYTLDPNTTIGALSTTIPIIVPDSVVTGTYTTGSSLVSDSIVRRESLYKWTSGIPEFLTNDSLFDYGARGDYEPFGYYAPIIKDFSSTIGQELKVEGGLTSADGLTITMVYPTNDYTTTDEIKYFYTSYRTTGSLGSLTSYSRDSISNDSGSIQFRREYLSPFIENSIQTYFGRMLVSDEILSAADDLFAVSNWGFDVDGIGTIFPVNNHISDEAIAVFECNQLSLSSSVDYGRFYANREVLNTEKISHSNGSLVYFGRKGIGSLCRIYVANEDDNSRSDWQLIYKGVIDDINFSNNLTDINISISNPIVELYRNTNNSKFVSKIDTFIPRTQTGNPENNVPPYPASYTDDFNVTAFQVGIKQINKFDRWQWIKVGKAALRLESDRSSLYQSFIDAYVAGYTDQNYKDIVFSMDGSTAIESLNPDDINRTVFQNQIEFYMRYSIPRFKNTSIGSINQDDTDYAIGPYPNMVVLDSFDYNSGLNSDGESFDSRMYYSDKQENEDLAVPGLPNPDGPLAGGLTSGKQNDPFYISNGNAQEIVGGDYRINRKALSYVPDMFNQAKLCHVFEVDVTPDGSTSGYFHDLYNCESSDKRDYDILDRYGMFIQCHVVQALLQILMSTGQGTNTISYGGLIYNFDKIPGEIGFGIPSSYIDIDSFFDIIISDYNDTNAYQVQSTYIVRNLAILQDDIEDSSKWIDENILKPFFLSLVQTKDGKLKLVRNFGKLEWINFNDINSLGLPTINVTDLAKESASSFSISNTISTDNLISKVLYKFANPPGAKQKSQILKYYPKITFENEVSQGVIPKIYTSGGLQSIDTVNKSLTGQINLYNRVNHRALEFDTKWYPLIPPDITPAWVFSLDTENLGFNKISAILTYLYSKPTFVIKLTCDESLITEVDIGDFVSMTLKNVFSISANFKKQSELYLGFVLNRIYDFKTNLTTLEIVYFDQDIFFNTLERRIGASGVITAVTSNTQFEIDSNAYSLTSQALQDNLQISYQLDYEGFLASDKIILLSPSFEIKGQLLGDANDYDPRSILTNSTGVITIDAAFEDSAGNPVTPVIGDLIIHARKELQINAQTINDWIYTYYRIKSTRGS